MGKVKKSHIKSSKIRELTDSFIPHLRWHYQVGILSAAYLLALIYYPRPDGYGFVLQFLNVHLLLYGGATAFNSYWDRDEGPVGGLRHPPSMKPWMRWGALLMMGGGILIASAEGYMFTSIYTFSAILFWGYSSPLLRWKGRPIASIAVIGLSTGTNSFLLGCLAAGVEELRLFHLMTALGVGSVLVSLYPISQIYQREEDQKRGDITFAIRYGVRGVRQFFGIAYTAGVVVLSSSMATVDQWLGGIFFFVSALVGGWIFMYFNRLKGREQEYEGIMRIKYLTSVAFILFILFSWSLIYYFRL